MGDRAVPAHRAIPTFAGEITAATPTGGQTDAQIAMLMGIAACAARLSTSATKNASRRKQMAKRAAAFPQ